MAGKGFKLISHTTLIKQQREDDEFIRLTLLVALHGLLTTYAMAMITFFSRINIRVLALIEQEPTIIDKVFSNLFFSLIFSLILSTVIVVIIEGRHQIFQDRAVLEEYDYVKSSFTIELEYEFEDKSEKELEQIIASKLKWDLLKVYGMGILAGVYSIFYYLIITFTIYIFFLMVIINFASSSVTALLSGLIATGFTILRLSIVKTNLKEEEVKEIDPHAEYAPTKRQIEIMDSDKPPIICPACRSYIAASSKFCKVCGEDLSTTEG